MQSDYCRIGERRTNSANKSTQYKIPAEPKIVDVQTGLGTRVWVKENRVALFEEEAFPKGPIVSIGKQNHLVKLAGGPSTPKQGSGIGTPLSALTHRYTKARYWRKRLYAVGKDAHEGPTEYHELPNSQARRNARKILAAAFSLNCFPDRLAASVEGGIGFTFINQDRVGYVEADNDGNIVFGHYSDVDEPQVWEASDDAAGAKGAIKVLQNYIYDTAQRT